MHYDDARRPIKMCVSELLQVAKLAFSLTHLILGILFHNVPTDFTIGFSHTMLGPPFWLVPDLYLKYPHLYDLCTHTLPFCLI